MDQDMSAAMLYVKKWIVQDERVRRKDPLDNALWLYLEARKMQTSGLVLVSLKVAVNVKRFHI